MCCLSYRSPAPSSGVGHVLSRELAESSDQGASSLENTPNTQRTLFPRDREEGESEAEVMASLEVQLEGFESRPSSRVMKQPTSDATEGNLHEELSQHEHTGKGGGRSRDSTPAKGGGSHDNHVTESNTSTALSHLTNDILTYSSQVAMTTTDNTSSVSQSTWLPSSHDNALHPPSSSSLTVNRVFKVVFLGQLAHTNCIFLAVMLWK